MLTIRLSRIGKKNKPMYRLTISEKARDTYGRALEILGSYNPYTKELQAKADRINYWLNQGSGMSPTVNNLLIDKGIIKGKKIKASKMRKKKKGKEAQVEAKPEGTKPAEEKKEEVGAEEKNKKIESKEGNKQPEASNQKPEEKSTESDKKSEPEEKKEDRSEKKENN
jgi:small subunit ribosomal protein S16